MRTVLIIGAGALGSAIAGTLKKKATVKLWDADPKRMPRPEPLSRAIKGADGVFLCVPSYATRDVATKIIPLIKKNAIVVSFTKGFEAETGMTTDAVLADILPKRQPFGIVGGPLLAPELRAGSLGAAVIASAQKIVLDSVKTLFRGTTVSVETSKDMRSVALLGVTKNIYTVALGAVDGLGWGKNMKGKVLVEIIREMERLVPMLGGKRHVVHDLAGVGDLVATGYSPESRNYQFGYALAQRRISSAPCEGPAALGILQKRLGTKINKFPLLVAIKNTLRKPKAASAEFGRAFTK